MDLDLDWDFEVRYRVIMRKGVLFALEDDTYNTYMLGLDISRPAKKRHERKMKIRSTA